MTIHRVFSVFGIWHGYCFDSIGITAAESNSMDQPPPLDEKSHLRWI